MDNISKFLADIDKIKKHDRAEHNNNYDGERVCLQIQKLFISNNRSFESLAASFADYWMQNYIYASSDIKSEPSQDNINRIAALQSLLENSTDDTDCLTKKDWKELCSLVNMEAEDLPIDLLNDLMIIFVDHQAL